MLAIASRLISLAYSSTRRIVEDRNKVGISFLSSLAPEEDSSPVVWFLPRLSLFQTNERRGEKVGPFMDEDWEITLWKTPHHRFPRRTWRCFQCSSCLFAGVALSQRGNSFMMTLSA